MATDDHDGNERPKSRGDTDKPTRDARGRWHQGYCPNPNGRPKKKLNHHHSHKRRFGCNWPGCRKFFSNEAYMKQHLRRVHLKDF